MPPSPDEQRPPLYLIGVPGRVGGASTKLFHLIRLLQRDYQITLVAPDIAVLKDKEVRRCL